MFLFRSLFWLTAAFLVIAPQVDLRETAQSAQTASWAALGATQAAVASYAPQIQCESFECVAGRAILTTAASQPLAPAASSDPTSPDALGALIAEASSPDAITAPRPLPRPASLL